SDAAWTAFRQWLEYFGKVFGVVTVAVSPHYTSADCSNCGKSVKKSLSQRTHRCPHCGFILDRDWNAAINILEKALRTVGHTGTLALSLVEGNASGDIDLCLGEETLLSKSSRGKRKPKK
ncbi:MAG: transposase, partial [Phormidium sp.]